jgi:hypothetical protein
VFVLNVLGEEDFGPIMKHFLKRFAPGQRQRHHCPQPLCPGSSPTATPLPASALP